MDTKKTHKNFRNFRKFYKKFSTPTLFDDMREIKCNLGIISLQPNFGVLRSVELKNKAGGKSAKVSRIKKFLC